MNRLHPNASHDSRNRLLAIARQAVASVYQKTGVAFLGRTEQFVNVALAISYVSAAGLVESRPHSDRFAILEMAC